MLCLHVQSRVMVYYSRLYAIPRTMEQVSTHLECYLSRGSNGSGTCL